MILDVILSHYKRARNVGKQIDAFRGGPHPVKLTLLDNPPVGYKPLSTEIATQVDRYIRVIPNPFRGAMRAVLAHSCESDWVLICDDDLLLDMHFPYRTIEQASDDVGIYGLRGKSYTESPMKFGGRTLVHAGDECVQVDTVSCCYLIRRSILAKLGQASRLFREAVGSDIFYREDDLVMEMCCRLSGLKSVVVSKDLSGDYWDLSSANSVSEEMRLSSWLALRHKMIDKLSEYKVS